MFRSLVSFFWFTGFLILALSANGDVSVSKTNGYTVIGPPYGVSISKTNGYAVLGSPGGVSVSKTNGYVIVGPASGVNVSKTVAYAVVIRKKQPTANIFTYVR